MISPEIRSARTRIQAAVLLGIVVLSRPGCTLETESGPLAIGTWGGEHMLIEIDQSVARVEFDCAAGTINVPIMLSDGDFSATGTFTQGHGGPTRVGETDPALPARYFGSVRGDVMTITVTLTGDNRSIGSFELKRGSSGRVFKCV
jgi:hypothetical protein